ncbi:putative quinol monooxygenase [Pseudoroseicyclus tamaricis]|uniref:Antibiotic biosynthesis monooxygenase n=1 Tax=Pseudoroseicyclus tamaricis TaxID=2705421 RepID=A0A6B2JZY7_9RHOB|nr:putative quinol monooxygenase [Pseudoroseicyclus tamaricis]NDV02239.1 antibiotic biosynthesis monooxygenase [Pseudoroseicyclus tamaricis]
MHGVVGKIVARPGQREAVIKVLEDRPREVPGCLSYVVARDVDDGSAVWVTEIWKSPAVHATSLRSPGAREMVDRLRPLVATVERVATTHILSGAPEG